MRHQTGDVPLDPPDSGAAAGVAGLLGKVTGKAHRTDLSLTEYNGCSLVCGEAAHPGKVNATSAT